MASYSWTTSIDFIQRGDIAIHAEDAIGDHQRACGYFARCSASTRSQVIRVAVGVADDLRPREPAAIDDAGMVQLIREDRILFAHQRRDRGQVGSEIRIER